MINKKKLKEVYDGGYWEVYDKLRNLPPYKRLIEKSIDCLEPGGNNSYCFLGIGTGNEALELRKRGIDGKIIGVDISKSMLKVANKKINGLETILVDVENLTSYLSESSIDNLVGIHVMGQLEDPVEATKEVFKTLKPGGRYVLTYPKDSGVLKLYKKSLGDIKTQIKKEGIKNTLNILKDSLILSLHNNYLSKIREENIKKTPRTLGIIKNLSDKFEIDEGYYGQDIIVYGTKNSDLKEVVEDRVK